MTVVAYGSNCGYLCNFIISQTGVIHWVDIVDIVIFHNSFKEGLIGMVKIMFKPIVW